MPAKKSMAKQSEPLRPPVRTKDLPATRGMLQLARTELKADIRELRSEMKAGFAAIDSRFNQNDSKLEHMSSEIARVAILVEEQNASNRIVLEGLTGLWQRQERIESRLAEEVERSVYAALARMKA